MIDSALLQSLLWERGEGVMVVDPIFIGLPSEDRYVQAMVDEVEEMLGFPVEIKERRGRAVYLRVVRGQPRAEVLFPGIRTD